MMMHSSHGSTESVRISRALMERIRKIAESESRKISGQIEVWLKECVERYDATTHQTSLTARAGHQAEASHRALRRARPEAPERDLR
jgi:hypothetical protein